MRIRKVTFLLCMLLFCTSSSLIFPQEDLIRPATPDASPEAVELLQYIYSISGKYTLTGQHCEPLFGSINLAGVEKMLGHYPAVVRQEHGMELTTGSRLWMRP